jgi:hypothetical protein
MFDAVVPVDSTLLTDMSNTAPAGTATNSVGVSGLSEAVTLIDPVVPTYKARVA